MTALSVQLQVAHDRCSRLRRLLDEEFEALREQDLARFEKLQGPKTQLLQELTDIVESHRAILESAETTASNLLASWDAFRASMLDCRDLHRRNELLILRKRDTIRGALQALVGGGDHGSSVEVYDRLGRVGRAARRQAYAQA